ncbi:MAG TPA: succinate dehydrogenase assembly factor 2 [Acidocella sp.]|jgi:antitoxin CptB|nr:succinate dehydrogenase assembly factor 2 [Acidocella sp.]
MTEFENAEPKPLDNRRRRLIFRAQHRGTYENDLLIGDFVVARIAGMSEVELDEIEAVMEFPDAELADWLTGRKPIPAHADSPMLRRIREAALNR